MDVAQIRALESVLADETAYPDETITTKLAVAQTIFERYLGFGLTTVERSDTLDGNGTRTLFVPRSYVSALSSVTVDSVAKTCSFLPNGRITAPTGDWFPEGSVVVVTYSHGINPVPEALDHAWGWYVRYLLLVERSRMDDRVTTYNDGEMTFSLAQASAERPTGLPAVDAVLSLFRFSRSFA